MEGFILTAFFYFKKKDHIFCCAFCDKANTDTCEFCWRLCALPTWFAIIIGVILLSILVILAIVVALQATKIF